MKKGGFWKLSWWKKILFLIFIMAILSIAVWILIAAILYFLSTDRSKETFGSYMVHNSTIKLMALLAAGVSAVVVIIIFWKLYRKHESVKGSGNEPSWVNDKIFYEFLITSFDKPNTSSPSFAFGVQTKHKRLKKTEIFFHVLAADRSTFSGAKKSRDGTIYLGSKKIDDLAIGSILILGSSGSYKTANIIKPTIIGNLFSSHKCSMIVTDPKGELYTDTVGIAEKMGYTVFKFNTINSMLSDCWNPLEEIWDVYNKTYLKYWHSQYMLKDKIKSIIMSGQQVPTEINELLQKVNTKIAFAIQKIESLIDNIIKNTSTVHSGQNSFFEVKGQVIEKAYFLIPLDFGISKSDYTPYNCAVNFNNIGAELSAICEMLPPWSLSVKYTVDLSAQYADVEASLNARQHASNNMEIFLNQSVRDLTSSNSINFDDIIHKPTIVYIGISTDAAVGDNVAKENEVKTSQIASLFCSSFYSYVEEYLATKSDAKLDKPLLYILDEAGNLPKMDFIPKLYTIGRGKNIFVCPVLQTRAQFDSKYGEKTTKTMFENAVGIIVAATDDLDISKMLAEMTGKRIKTSISTQYSEQGDEKGKSSSEQENWKIAPEFFIQKKPNEHIIKLRGRDPYKYQFTPFYNTSCSKKIISTFDTKNAAAKSDSKYHYTPIITTSNFYKELIPKSAKIMWLITYKNKKVPPALASVYENMSQELSKFNIEKEYNDILLFKDIHGWYPGFGLEKYIQ